MPTNPLGPGTCNVTLNVPVEWRSALGRAAFKKDKSRNDFICQLVERALEAECPELAKEIKTARERHKMAARLGVVKAGSLMLAALVGWLSLGIDDQQLRRPRGRTGIVRVVRVRGKEVEVSA